MRPSTLSYRWTVAILLAAVLGLVAALLVPAVISSFDSTCEVCMAWRGRVVCREGVGATRDEAVRTATRFACAFLSIDEAETALCVSRPAVRLSCAERSEISPRPASSESP